MDDNLTPSQSKQAKLRAKQASANHVSENQHPLTSAENNMTSEKSWAQWEIGAHKRKWTQQELRQMDMSRKALEDARKTDPTIGHVYYGEAEHIRPEELRMLKNAFEATLRRHR